MDGIRLSSYLDSILQGIFGLYGTYSEGKMVGGSGLEPPTSTMST